MALPARKQPHRKGKPPVCKQPKRGAKARQEKKIVPASNRPVKSGPSSCCSAPLVELHRSVPVWPADVMSASDPSVDEDIDSVSSCLSLGSCMECGGRGTKGLLCCGCEDSGVLCQ